MSRSVTRPLVLTFRACRPGERRCVVTTANDVRLSMLLAELPAKVKLTRAQRHLSLRQAGAQIGMAYADLNRFENGLHDPQWSTVVKLLRIDPEEYRRVDALVELEDDGPGEETVDSAIAEASGVVGDPMRDTGRRTNTWGREGRHWIWELVPDSEAAQQDLRETRSDA